MPLERKAPVNDKLGYFIKDNSIIDELKSGGVRRVMVVGGSDTGKTTLVEGVADLLSTVSATGVADLDMGQSHIGPPATFAWGKVEGGFKRWHDITIEDFYFIGAISPPGNLLPAIVGAKKIVEQASKQCEKLVIDTTGLIAEPVGRILKEYKIDTIDPDMILALERERELEGILGSLKFRKRPSIKRLKVPKEVALKSASLRSEFRGLKFREYFSGSRAIEVSSKETGIRFTGETPGGDMTGRIVSLRDETQRDLALGIIEGADPAAGWYVIRSPIVKGLKFTTLVIGTAFVTL